MNFYFAFAAVAALMFASASAEAAPTPYTFNTVGGSSVNGTYGNVIAFDTSKSSTLKLSVTGWQSNLYTNAITSAYLGAYTGGLGVTGVNDAKGANNLHQIDNLNGYTDFVLLEFNRAVTLTSIVTNSYGINGIYDNDAVWYDASKVSTSTWNSTEGFSSYYTVPSLWSNVAAGGSGTLRATGALTASTKWLVAAAFNPLCDRDDGFKIASVNVTEATAPVPEPATWATMTLGLGIAGAVLRRRRRRTGATALA